MVDLVQITQRLIEGDIQGVQKLTIEALTGGIPAKEILKRGLLPGMKVVGDKFKKNLIYIPEVVLSAKAMQAGMELLRPHLEAMMFKGSGFEVVDLGIDVSPERFGQEVVQRKAHILALSALLTTSMPNMKRTLDLLSEKDLRGGLITMVGGAPITQAYADEIGADGYAQNASLAVERVKDLLKSQTPQSPQEL
jgi:5-methyltetrahydrofolate--homocysteine methyltransferase